MDSEFDQLLSIRAGYGSRDRGLYIDSAASPFSSALYKPFLYRASQLPAAYRLPVEIFSEIFLYAVQVNPRSQAELMLVCRHWRDIMLSTPGIHSRLKIHRETTKKYVERIGKSWLLDVTVDPENVPTVADPWLKSDLDPVEFHACFMVAAEAASRWRSLALLSLPPPGEYKDLQIIHPLQHLESFKLAASCDLGNFLEPLLNAITTTVTPRFSVMEVFHHDAAFYLLQPAHFQIFLSLTTLRLICRRTQNPVDVLPFLHRLEILEAHHLFLPMYPPEVDLPLVQTLRVLHLRSVSVQWMAGRVFLALEECSIIYPRHADTVQSVHMPSCSNLKYDSNNLGALEHFHIFHLDKLEIKCGQWNTWRGTLQLVILYPIFASQSLTSLHLDIKCSERLLAYMLRLAPALEELWMWLSSPHALSSAFFLAFAAGGPNADACSSSQTIVPLGRKLRALHLHYKRWLRGPERNGLIRVFGAIVLSHPLKEQKFSFRFGFDEGSALQEWFIHEPVKKLNFGDFETTTIGFSSLDGIVPLSRSEVDGRYGLTESEYLLPPRESEYITTDVRLDLPIDFLFSFYRLKEVNMTSSNLKMKPDTQFSLDAPIFHTLEVLIVSSISLSFFVGQTFPKLETFKQGCIEFDEWYNDEPIQEDGPLTEMPVCAKLAVPLSTLSILKLPKIRELRVHHIGKEDHIWEKHIAVNANLLELKLLHVLHVRVLPSIAFIRILELLPALESLIIGLGYYHPSFVERLEAFIPTNVRRPKRPNPPNREGQMSGVVCPRLESLNTEGIDLARQAELMPILKNIVTLRAAIGSPLKSFTMYFDGCAPDGSYSFGKPPRKWQLIGRDNGFTVEEVVPAERFRLDI